VLALCIPALHVLFRFVVAERVGAIILSVVVAHVSWHWMAERFAIFSQYQIPWPALSLGLVLSVLGWLVVAAIVAGLGWLAFGLLWNPAANGAASEATGEAAGTSTGASSGASEE